MFIAVVDLTKLISFIWQMIKPSASKLSFEIIVFFNLVIPWRNKIAGVSFIPLSYRGGFNRLLRVLQRVSSFQLHNLSSSWLARSRVVQDMYITREVNLRLYRCCSRMRCHWRWFRIGNIGCCKWTLSTLFLLFFLIRLLLLPFLVVTAVTCFLT